MDKTTAETLKLLLEQIMENKRSLLGMGREINLRFEVSASILRLLASCSMPQEGHEEQFAAVMDVIEDLVKIGKTANSDLNKMDFGISQAEAVIEEFKALIDRRSGRDSHLQNEGETDEPRQG